MTLGTTGLGAAPLGGGAGGSIMPPDTHYGQATYGKTIYAGSPSNAVRDLGTIAITDGDSMDVTELLVAVLIGTVAMTDDDVFASGLIAYLDSLEAVGQFVLSSASMAQVDTSVVAPPSGVTVASRDTISNFMLRPARLRGVPLHPLVYAKVEGSAVIASGSQILKPSPPAVQPDPPAAPTASLDPESIPGFTYRWRASSLAGSVGSYITSWPEYNAAGPAWSSVAPYRPKVTAFSIPTKGIEYSAAIQFNRAYVEHMWMDLGSVIAQPSSWVIIGWLIGGHDANTHTHMLDGHEDYTYRRLMHLRGSEFRMEGGGAGEVENGRLGAPWSFKNDIAIFYGVFDGASSLMRVHGSKFSYAMTGQAGTGSERKILLGRQRNKILNDYASNMAVLEILYYQSALDLTDHMQEIIDKYAAHTYQMGSW